MHLFSFKVHACFDRIVTGENSKPSIELNFNNIIDNQFRHYTQSHHFKLSPGEVYTTAWLVFLCKKTD